MNSKLRVREALDVLYMQGEDAGKSNYGSATHQIAAVTEAEKAIRQAVGEEMLERLTEQATTQGWICDNGIRHDIQAIPLSAIEKEHNKLKENKNGN